MGNAPSLGMQWLMMSVLVLVAVLGFIACYVLRNELKDTRKSTETMTEFLAQATVALTSVNETLPIVKGWAELGRIGGIHSREAIKEVEKQTAPLTDIVKKIDEIPSVVEQAVKAATGSKDIDPGDSKIKLS